MGLPSPEVIKELNDLAEYKGKIERMPLAKIKKLTNSTQWNIRARSAQKAQKLMTRLYNTAMGNTEMSSVQLRAATTFLDRCLPAMQHYEIEDKTEQPQSRDEMINRAASLMNDHPQLAAIVLASNPELVKALPQLLRKQAAEIQDRVEDSEAIESGQGVEQ